MKVEVKSNDIRVRLFHPGDRWFEFWCAGFRTFRNDEGGKDLCVNFNWEKLNEEGDEYDRSYGAPEAVKSFMFSVQCNNSAIENRLENLPRISARTFSANGVWIDNVSDLEMEVFTY